MKFIKDGFYGVMNGDIYPKEFKKGDECPKELEQAASEQGFIRVSQKQSASQTDDLLAEADLVQEQDVAESLAPTSDGVVDAAEEPKGA